MGKEFKIKNLKKLNIDKDNEIKLLKTYTRAKKQMRI